MREHTQDHPQDHPQDRLPEGPPGPDAGILAAITAGVAAGDDLDALLQRFLDPIVRLAGAQGGAVRVLSARGDQLERVSGIGVPADLCGAGAAVDRHCGACGTAADGQPLVWATDLSGCAERSQGAYFGQDCRRLLAVPLQHRGRILGVYNLFFAGADAPGPEVLAILRSVGDLLGLALDNARLERENLRATLLHERQRMAAEVHDSLAQSIAYVKMRMALLQDALLANDQARALQYCDDVRGVASQAHTSLRAILTHLRAPMDPRGLLQALEASAEHFRRSSGAMLDVVNEWPGLRLAPEQEAQVFHIVQEALTNVERHAGAQHAWLRIAAPAPDEVAVLIEDDGAGLPAAGRAGGSHYGLEIMAERARRIGGRLEVGPRDGGGTRVRLAFPLRNPTPSSLGVH
jgi:two-component system, NarL family, nitrate/nitrite sensor histidine kinase NarX